MTQKNLTSPTAAMLVIGDEILSGRTRDSNMHHLAKALIPYGIALKEARIVADTPDAIIDGVQALSRSYTYVFTSGGIGPTHDDITADCIAKAFDTPIDIRDDARALLEAHYAQTDKEVNDARLRMARIPDGAALIDNPISTAPGFTLKNVHVMAGVPKIFEAMLHNVLPTLQHGVQMRSENIRIMRGEGDIAHIMSSIAEQMPNVSIGSYPFQVDGAYGTNIVLRSTDENALKTATHILKAQIEQ